MSICEETATCWSFLLFGFCVPNQENLLRPLESGKLTNLFVFKEQQLSAVSVFQFIPFLLT